MFLRFWTFHLLVWKDILFSRCGDFAQCWDENMHFCTFPAYGKVGVNQKILVDMSCFWRTKIVCFTSFKDQFNPRKWKKSLKVQNFEVAHSAICAIFTLFPPEKFYFEIFSKTNAISITFWLRYMYIHGKSLPEIDSPTQNAVDRF